MSKNNYRIFRVGSYVVVWLLIVAISIFLFTNEKSDYTSTQQPTVISNKCLRFYSENTCIAYLEVADEDQERIRGLSYRQSLPKDHGMVFVDEISQYQCFWMKDMNFSLDLIWLNSEKEVVAIDKNISPETYPEQFCRDDINHVIELNSGFAEKAGIKPGQKLIF